MVKDINSGPTGGKPLGLINFNGLLVFSASQSSSSMEIWSSNGTASGTTIAKTLENNADLVLFNGGVYFTGYRILNRTNGTGMGTYIVRNFDPCFEQQLTVQNDQEKMFFCYPDLNCTSDLWVMHKIPTPTNVGDALAHKVRVYPNPATDIVSIELGIQQAYSNYTNCKGS